jgi:hypothetical protein
VLVRDIAWRAATQRSSSQQILILVYYLEVYLLHILSVHRIIRGFHDLAGGVLN